jgi:3-phenylpropionate/trans-cinnamate dioxygenase ferredoxin component
MAEPNDGWVCMGPSADLLPGEKRSEWMGETPVLMVNLDGEIHALEDRCTHEDFELSVGHFDPAEGSIECALHGAKFDVRDGRALCAPAYTSARRFEARIADGLIWLREPPTAPGADA